MPAEVREARPALVEEDQPEPLRQALVEGPPARQLPEVDEVGDVVRDVDEVDLALAYDLIRDGDSAAAGVADVEAHHGQFPRLTSWPQPLPSASSSSPENGSRPASGSRFARRTPARSSGAWRKPAPTRRGGPSPPASRRSASRCRPTSARRSAFASSRRWPGATRRSRGRSPTRPESR